ncbi:hypothetical protein [Timonella senegalensis]|uniref:hypothetical protein n=1 Tax=Timonella senegalensis TaxID=1465825 RepID=UPI0002F378DE|nr:hypothetical protein [Timonella senegalensis]
MTAELAAMWQTIHEAYPYAKTSIEKSNTPADGMPHAPSDPRKTPVNLTALSWTEMTDRLAAKWGHTITTMPTSVTELYNNLGPADQLDLQTDTWTIHNQAHQWLPAHITAARLTIEQCAGHHCTTIEELAWVLNTLGHPKPQGTLRRWATEGHLTKTPAGYPLTQALERINA